MFDPIKYTTLPALGVDGSPDAPVAMVEQGTSQWLGLRAGKISASNASLIVTSTGKVAKGKTRDGYIWGSIAERLTGSVEVHMDSLAMQRGRQLEPQAKDYYRFETGRKVQDVGFVFGDADKQYGCSPDGLCSDRGLECKAPLRKNSVGTVLAMRKSGKIPNDYWCQVQMSMFVTGLPLWDFCIFNPEMSLPSAIITIEADAKYHELLGKTIQSMVAEIEDGMTVLQEDA